MTGQDIVRRREAIGLSPEALAADLHEHTDQVRAWESVTGHLPRTLTRRLDWALALAEREAAVRAAGVPPCPEVQAISSPAGPTQSAESLQALTAQLDAHAATCSLCQRRQAIWDAQPPLPPPPLPPLVSLFAAIQTHSEQLPPYLRPALWGAVGFGLMTLFRSAIMLATSGGRGLPQAALAVLVSIGVGGYGGAAWGIAAHFARPRFAPLGRAGDYLTGITVMGAIASAFAIPAAAFNLDPFFRTGLWWALLGAGAILIGLVLGHRVLRSPRSPTGV